MKHAATIWPRNRTLGLLAQRKENLESHKSFYKNVFSYFIYNSLKLSTAQMSFNGWIVIQALIHAYHAIPLSNKKDYYSNKCNNLNASPENCAESKKSISKGYIPDDSTYRTFLNWQNYKKGDQISDCQN